MRKHISLSILLSGALILSGCSFLSSSKDEETAPESKPIAVSPVDEILPVWAQLSPGQVQCAAGASFHISYVNVGETLDITWKGKSYTLHNVPTQSGAYRYENKEAGLLFVQSPKDGNLLDMKAGQRLAKQCKQ